jgi:hypothetical protein
MAAFFFASPVDVDIKLEGEDARKQVETKGEKDKIMTCPVYFDGEPVSGQVCLLFASSSHSNLHTWAMNNIGFNTRKRRQEDCS